GGSRPELREPLAEAAHQITLDVKGWPGGVDRGLGHPHGVAQQGAGNVSSERFDCAYLATKRAGYDLMNAITRTATIWPLKSSVASSVHGPSLQCQVLVGGHIPGEGTEC